MFVLQLDHMPLTRVHIIVAFGLQTNEAISGLCLPCCRVCAVSSLDTN